MSDITVSTKTFCLLLVFRYEYSKLIHVGYCDVIFHRRCPLNPMSNKIVHVCAPPFPDDCIAVFCQLQLFASYPVSLNTLCPGDVNYVGINQTKPKCVIIKSDPLFACFCAHVSLFRITKYVDHYQLNKTQSTHLNSIRECSLYEDGLLMDGNSRHLMESQLFEIKSQRFVPCPHYGSI